MTGSNSDPERGVASARLRDSSDDAGFAEFFRSCRPTLTRTLMALTDDTRVVEDVTQDALLLTRHRWTELRGYDKPEAWVLKVALRALRRWQTRSRRETTLTALHDNALPMADSIARSVERDEIHAAIRRLSPRRAEVVVLHHLLGYPIAEISEILGVTQATVRSHLCLGRADLKAMLGTSEEGDL